VTVSTVQESSSKAELVLPGNIQAMTEAPILARADGYVKRRYVDIGDRVRAGQLVAEIEAPEIGQQVQQAKAALQQSQSALEQARANYRQGKTNEELARVTAQRWGNLLTKGVVSRQENDTYQAQYQAQVANSQALEKAIAAAQSNVAAAEANLARLTELEGYQQVRAPFAGVITVRNVDVGALITSGTTLLFRVAQTNPVRTYINVPQADAPSVHVGQQADLLIPDQPGKHYTGTVTRTSNSLDPASRTLLVEVQVKNPDGTLLPGTYCQVDLNMKRAQPPVLIPGDTLVIRGDGPQVAVVQPDQTVHFQKLVLGRDYGDRIEVISGVEKGQSVIANPSDAVREGVKVKPVPVTAKPAPKAAGGSH
jgi:RND family efflux transporter MFP subunit